MMNTSMVPWWGGALMLAEASIFCVPKTIKTSDLSGNPIVGEASAINPTLGG